MSSIKKNSFTAFLMLGATCLVACSTAPPVFEKSAAVAIEKPIVLSVDMSTDKVSDATSTFQFTDTGRYIISYSWTDLDQSAKLASPERLQFTVSAWDQDREIYVEHFSPQPSFAPTTEEEFLNIGRSNTNTPIEILVIGTLGSSSQQRQGTLDIVIRRKKPG